jgi:hypothetical protein
LIVYPDKIKPGWWRRDGHSLSIEDLKEAIKLKPEMLIIGTGSAGFMRVPLATKLSLKEQGIGLIEKDTAAAARVFNEQLDLGRDVVGAFHLTC